MLAPKTLFDLLAKHDISHTVGVPDSLLKFYCSYAFDQGQKLIAANEGNAVAMAAGYHLATGKIPLVYMQNSGFGNTINPLTSLVNEEVYSIPMLLMVGWRGEPGVKDAPQHTKQGAVMTDLIEAMKLPYAVLSTDEAKAETQIEEAVKQMKSNSAPFVLLVKKGTFEDYKLKSPQQSSATLKREKALQIVSSFLNDNDIVVSTTGKTSRELYEIREQQKSGHHRDFLTVGSMGHASQIALGIALEKSDRTVYCIDGDGAVIMHMGGLSIIGDLQPENFKHIVINNGAHESVGGQPTAGFSIDFGQIAKGCGYTEVMKASNEEELQNALSTFSQAKGPALLEIITKTGSRSDLGRPELSPQENKKLFMNFLK